MLSLTSRPLSNRARGHLTTVQAKINNKSTFAERSSAAQEAWKSKKKAHKHAFADIKHKLLDMCVATGICNYCENNEATDIEHIFPKSFFPEMAFVWENYLLACKTCNSHYKLDKIAVFNPSGSSTRFDVRRNTQPPTQDVLMINPRTENPLDFLELNLKTGIFHKKQNAGSRAYFKAEYTLEVLHLNARDALREAREARARELFRKLQIAVSIEEADSFEKLEAIINGNDPFIDIDSSRSIEEVKTEFLNSIRHAIATAPHPTVWVEMKRQNSIHSKIRALFARLPEALDW